MTAACSTEIFIPVDESALAVPARLRRLRRAHRLRPAIEDGSERAAREFDLDLAGGWASGWLGPPPTLG